jgi:hypothetical protein
MYNKCIKKSSTLLAIKEMKIKATVRVHQSDWQSSRNQTLRNIGECTPRFIAALFIIAKLWMLYD